MKHFTSKTQKIGEIGEEKACQYLIVHGYRIIERNVANMHGEIDIVAKKGSTHYFFEVKTGKKGGWINPAENLTKEKLGKIYRSVAYYALVHTIKEYKVKGLVVLLKEGGEVEVESIDLT